MKAIEFGGGNQPIYRPNVDIRKLDNVDIIIDLNYKKYPIQPEEYDLVYSRYLIEHISWLHVRNFFKEIYRILKPGGRIQIITSNLLEQAKVLINTPPEKWDDNILGLLFGAEDYPENTHRCGFSPQSITKILTNFGFENIEITPINSDFGPTDMLVKAVKYGTISDKDAEIITGIDRRNWVLQHCELGKKILDIGSADGWIFKDSPFIPYVTSIDLDKYDLPNFHQMDAHNLQFPDKSFDIAIVGEIIEHCTDPIQVLKEANRVARKLLITIPDEWHWDDSLFPFESIHQGMKRRNLSLEEIVRVSNPHVKELYTGDNHQHLFHNRYLTEFTLRQYLEKAGIVNYEITRLQYGNPKWSFFIVVVDEDLKKNSNKKPIITIGPTIPEDDLKIMKDTLPEAIQSIQNIFNRKEKKEKVNNDFVLVNNSNIIRNVKSEKDSLRIGLISTPFFGTPPKKYGGLEQIVWDLAEGLDELGHKVTIFAPEGSQTPKHGKLVVTGPSINTVNVDWFEEERKRYETYKDMINPDKYDIVHDMTWFSFPYLLKRKYPNLRIIHTHHGSFVWESPPNW